MLDQPLQKLNRIEKATKVIIKDYKITAGLFFSICITSLFLIALPLQQPISLHVMVLVFILVTGINSLYFGWQSGFTSLLFGCMLFCSILAFQSPTNSTSLNLNLSVTGGFLVVFFAVLLFISQRTLKKEMLYIEGQQQSISESDYLLRSLAENIESVFWVTDPKKSQVYYVSPAFQDVFERSPDSIYKNSNKYIDFIHPEDKPKMIQLMQESNTDARSSLFKWLVCSLISPLKSSKNPY